MNVLDLLLVLLLLVAIAGVTVMVAAGQRRRFNAEVLKLRQHLDQSEKASREARQRATVLVALHDIGRTIASSFEIDEVFAAFAATVKTLLDYDRLSIELLTPSGEEMDVITLSTNSGNLTGKSARVPVLNSAPGWVVAHRQPLLREDLTTEGTFPFDSLARELGLRSELIVPIVHSGGVVGTLSLASHTSNRYSPRDLEVLQQIAQEVAIALENARLYRRSREMATVEERNRLAREIHSTIAQHLIALILQLQATRDLLPRNAGELSAELREAEDLARLTLEEARRSAWGLQPPSLESLSVAQAIAKELAFAAKQGGFAHYFAVRGQERPLSAEQETALFRIAQEATRNSRRHAMAREVEGTLEYGENEVILTLHDDGIGFDAESELGVAPEQATGYGLASMQERARLLGGTFQIESSPGHGTRLQASIPYRTPPELRITGAFGRLVNNRIKVLIADSQPLARDSIRRALEAAGIRVIGEAADGREVVGKARDLRPDVVLLDLQMPGLSAAQVIAQLVADSPEISPLILTTQDRGEPRLGDLPAGAKGFLPKDTAGEQLVKKVQAAYLGEDLVQPGIVPQVIAELGRSFARSTPSEELTQREMDVLRLMAKGARNKEIGRQLLISDKTVKFHVANIFQKLGADSRTEAVSLALERKLL